MSAYMRIFVHICMYECVYVYMLAYMHVCLPTFKDMI